MAASDSRHGLAVPEADRILAWLDVPPVAATRDWLDALLTAYVQRVPWESASRIARRISSDTPAGAVAGPAAFWEAAMTQGTGGTCFESNAALAALLTAVGIDSTFTINDMPPTIACHTALLVGVGGQRLMVDAGFPVHAAIPLPRADEVSEVHTRWGTYSAKASPAGPDRFLIGQSPRPKPIAFEFIDRPVSSAAYADATRADYESTGLFLDVVVIKKVVDGDVWRFTSGEQPWTLERFCEGTRETTRLPTRLDDTAARLAGHFSIDQTVVARALTHVHLQRGHDAT